MSIACPHCASAAQAVTAFCTACGKALPAAARRPPRILKDREFAVSVPGRALQADLLDKGSRAAGRTMMWLGIVQLLFGILFFAAAGLARQGGKTGPSAMIWGISSAAVGCIFLGLSVWGRRSPLAATFTGLMIYLTLTAYDALSLAAVSEGGIPVGIGQGLAVRLIILGVLARSITSGIRHRALLRAAQPQP